ncbi:hypothetical protein PSM36_2462 [Proteiniphilum saccharofermentans]|uniref:Uncharacterized protein n=1 Tax=Proteiniphilum saccharofermentans TaxID=1642647 RepID=A0A1R3TBB2_9BACT|nr:hypothetical protein PSM36_2462 [Proteiniphilum saccharofermentans]
MEVLFVLVSTYLYAYLYDNTMILKKYYLNPESLSYFFF